MIPDNDSILYNLIWFLQHTALVLLICCLLAFLTSRYSPIIKLKRGLLLLYSAWICVGLVFCPEPFYEWSPHDTRMEALLSPGVAVAFGIVFALSSIRRSNGYVKAIGWLCLLLHVTVLFLIVYHQFR